MKIQFDPNLDFQKQAMESIAGVFEGQEICRTNFTVTPLQYTTQNIIPGMENNLGIGNRLKLLDEDIHKNIRKIQLKNGLAGIYTTVILSKISTVKKAMKPSASPVSRKF